MNKIKFTENSIEKLSPPDKGRKYYYDLKTQGFCICVTSAGTKTFYVYRKVHGRPEHIRLGKWPSLSVSKARISAGEINNQIDKGTNPNDLRRKKRNELTLGEFFNIYYNEHVKLHISRPSEYKSRFENHLKPLSNRKLSSIGREEVQRLLNKLANEKSTSVANESIKLLRAIYNKANDWGYCDIKNPVERVKLFKEKSRDRFLNREEITRFLDALNFEPNETHRDFILMALFTGARRSNLQEMRWSNISLGESTWHIPETKNGFPQLVHLVKEAREILIRRRLSSISDWVFPGPGKTGHIVEPKKAFSRVLETAGIKDFRFHDLRRTHASYMAMAGVNLAVVGKALGHRDIKSTSIYNRFQEDTVKDGMQKGVEHMMGKLLN